ncbi:MAG: HEAT repeat domain-containing protein [Myxococcales bacterium]|nr:HEAT repeat domain-containing protein [Myxococcales bacterium]
MKNLFRLGLGAMVALTLISTGSRGKTDEGPPAMLPSAAQFEVISTPEAIKDVALRGSPIAIWETLEKGEVGECLDCIAYVEPLLFDKDAHVREISAWWIRRRVFGYAEVALRVRGVLASDADPVRRAAAANALGEFMDPGGTKLLVTAIEKDTSPLVRAAAVAGLRRLNDIEGGPGVTTALGDTDPAVRRAAVEAATRLAGFGDVPSVAKLLSDPDLVVRAKAADALGFFKSKGAIAGLSALGIKDGNEDVRIAAINALGEIGDPAARSILEQAQANDTSSLVRDAARIALLKLALSA